MVYKLETMLKALADRSRLRIIGLLGQRPLCVCELQHILNLSQSTVSEHLRVLRAAGLIAARQNSFWTDFYLKPPAAGRALVALIKASLKNDPEFQPDLKKSKNIDRKKICCLAGGDR